MNKRIQNSIWGFIVGDCLGVPFEFKEKGTFKCNSMIGDGTHDQPAGTWSDDTSLMLSLIGSNNEEEHKRLMSLWFKNGLLCCDDKLFDIGYSTKQAILNNFKHIDLSWNGNGSILRIWTLAFINCPDQQIKECMRLTHGDNDTNYNYCRFFIYFLRNLDPFSSKQVAYEKTINQLGFEIDLENTVASGYIKDSVEAAIYSFINGKNYKDCVLTAVNLGNDTDSVAALTGALAGYYYNRICFKDKVRNKGKIESIINRYVNNLCEVSCNGQ